MAKRLIKSDGVWYYVNESGNGSIRKIPAIKGLEKLDTPEPANAERIITEEGVKQLVGRFPNIDDPGAWISLVTKIENQHEPKRKIPLTALRTFYWFLADHWNKELGLAFAKSFEASPGSIAALVQKSSTQFSSYSNTVDLFRDDEETSDLPENNATNRLANRLLATVNSGDIAIQGTTPLVIRYVQREMCPYRTTNGVFEDGSSAKSSGAGGIDFLFAAEDGTPIVGEYKSDSDKPLFYALIQSLAYACELATADQRARLKRSFPNVEFSDDTCVDVMFIVDKVPTSKDKSDYEVFLATESLAKQLYQHEAVYPVIRSISCVKVVDSAAANVSFELLWRYPG
jgi:hypothetical protein